MRRCNPPLGGYKKHPNHILAGHAYTILKQLCNLIPGHLVSHLAKEFGVDAQSQALTQWSKLWRCCSPRSRMRSA